MPVLNTEVVALRSGYLDKKGDIRKNWKKRWFVLQTDGTLPYPEPSQKTGTRPLGRIGSVASPACPEQGWGGAIYIRMPIST